jgi:hypothetical protein
MAATTLLVCVKFVWENARAELLVGYAGGKELTALDDGVECCRSAVFE